MEQNIWYPNDPLTAILRGYIVWRRECLQIRAPFYWHGLTLIPAWVSNYTHCNLQDEITYPFLNLNGATVEV